MFSGKSEELIRRVRRALIAGRRVQLFKSHLDDRYGGQFRISSHDGRELDAEPVSTSVQVAERVHRATQVVAIDEAQFLDDGIGQPAPAEGPTIQVGGAESYEARCRRCHEVPMRDRAQRELLPKRGGEGWEGI